MARIPVAFRLGAPALTGLILFAAGLSACSMKEPLDNEAAYEGSDYEEPSAEVATEEAEGDENLAVTETSSPKSSPSGDVAVTTATTLAGKDERKSASAGEPPPPPARQLESLGYFNGDGDMADGIVSGRGDAVAAGAPSAQAVSPAREKLAKNKEDVSGRASRTRNEDQGGAELDNISSAYGRSGGTVSGTTGGIVGPMAGGSTVATRTAGPTTVAGEQKPLDDRFASADPAPRAEPAKPAVPDVTSGSESYEDYGVNPFTMVSADHLSTFAIDVDTASYSIARRKLEEGRLPPEAAVRVEEFINYFDFSYGQPTGDVPFNVAMEAMPDPFRSGHHVLRVGVQGKDVSRDERPAVHLTFLVDVSGSMSSPDKLPLAKKSLHMLVDSLREDDTVALAVYAGRTARVLEPTSAGNKRAIHDAIEALQSGGSTAMSSGIDLAYEMAWQSFEEGAENRVIVLSDGDANVGRTSWDEMLTQIKGYADRGVTVSTIGFGMGNYQDTLMEQLSNKGDGNNFYIDDAEQAQRVFVDELGGTMVTIARDVKIQVDFNDESVLAYRLLGYENRDVADKDFRNDKVDAGEIGAGHNVTALYEVVLKDGYTRELATVRVRWEKPGADVDQGGSGGMERAYTFRDSDLKETPYLAGRDTRIAYAAATFAEILRGSPHTQEIDLAALARFTSQSARKGEQDDVELVGLMKKADQLGADGAFLADN